MMQTISGGVTNAIGMKSGKMMKIITRMKWRKLMNKNNDLEQLDKILKKHTSEYYMPNEVLKLIDPTTQEFWDDILKWKRGD